MTWIGYPNTTGLPAIDYRLTDSTCDPLDTTQPFTEELLRLPECFLCYTPPHDAPAVAPLPALLNGHVTFGSFNNLGKVTGGVMSLWGRVLKAVPGSRLLLKSKPFACGVSKRHYLELLAQHVRNVIYCVGSMCVCKRGWGPKLKQTGKTHAHCSTS